MIAVALDGPPLVTSTDSVTADPTAALPAGGSTNAMRRSAFGFGATAAVAVLLARSGSGWLAPVSVAISS